MRRLSTAMSVVVCAIAIAFGIAIVGNVWFNVEESAFLKVAITAAVTLVIGRLVMTVSATRRRP